MTDALGTISNLNGLTDQLYGNQLREPGQDSDVIGAPDPFSSYSLIDIMPELLAGLPGAGTPVTFPEYEAKGILALSIGQEWYGNLHIVPKRIDFGNILTTLTEEIEIYNAHIDENRTFQNFINNVGDGLDIPDLPTLPYTLGALSGVILTVEVTTDGVPTFDSTLDFVFDTTTLELPVTGTRVIVFPFEPELPLNEKLVFLTNILPKRIGSEQRIALRKNPRQIFEFALKREENIERSRLEFLMYDWQSRIFGLPIWSEPTYLTTAASASDTIIYVASTEYADYREDGLAIVIIDESTYDTIKLSNIQTNSLAFTSGLSRNYPIGTLVYPVRVAMADTTYSGNKYPVGMSEYRLRFKVKDNDSSLADTSAFSTFSGKVLLDGPNFLPSGLQDETLQRQIIEFDNETGILSQISTWTRSKRETYKVFKTSNRKELWEVRQLLHALRGQQISFWLPTFYKELNVLQTLGSGSTTMVITNVGYTTFVQSRSPRNVIRLELSDGTVLTRTILNGTVIDSASEQLTVDSVWPSNIDPNDIVRIDFFEKIRLNSDEVQIIHFSASGEAQISFPVKVVFD